MLLANRSVIRLFHHFWLHGNETTNSPTVVFSRDCLMWRLPQSRLNPLYLTRAHTPKRRNLVEEKIWFQKIFFFFAFKGGNRGTCLCNNIIFKKMYFFFEKKKYGAGCFVWGWKIEKCKVTHNYYYSVGKNFPLTKEPKKKKMNFPPLLYVGSFSRVWLKSKGHISLTSRTKRDFKKKKKTNGREKKEPGKKDPTSSIPPLSLSL